MLIDELIYNSDQTSTHKYKREKILIENKCFLESKKSKCDRYVLNIKQNVGIEFRIRNPLEDSKEHSSRVSSGIQINNLIIIKFNVPINIHQDQGIKMRFTHLTSVYVFNVFLSRICPFIVAVVADVVSRM